MCFVGEISTKVHVEWVHLKGFDANRRCQANVGCIHDTSSGGVEAGVIGHLAALIGRAAELLGRGEW